jgi:hypothetical protein
MAFPHIRLLQGKNLLFWPAHQAVRLGTLPVMSLPPLCLLMKFSEFFKTHLNCHLLSLCMSEGLFADPCHLAPISPMLPIQGSSTAQCYELRLQQLTY